MFICLNKSANGSCIQFSVVVVLFFFMISGANARPEAEKNYLRLEQNKSSEKNDLKISSIGGLAFIKNRYGHFDLSYLESDIQGNELALDFGSGYVFNWDVSLFLGVGISLGYNRDEEDFIGAYYPEAGIVWDITEEFGITVSAKRFYNRYEENEDVVMMGLVFR